MGMGRPRVKRGYNIYRKKRNPWKIAAITLICLVSVAAVTFLALAAYSPLLDYLDKASLPGSSGREASISDSSLVSRAPAVSAPQNSSRPAVPFAPVEPGEMRAAFMPAVMLPDLEDAETYMKLLKDYGYNTVIMEAKDSEGRICYKSSDTFIHQCGLMRDNGVGDIPALVELAHSLKLTVYASVYAFEDHIASNRNFPMAVRFNGAEETFWLDAARDEGGMPWLDPCSQEAQDYIVRVVDELTLYGVDGILLEGAHYPVSPGWEYAVFGDGSETQSLADVLSSFINRCRLTAAANDSLLLYSITASGALGTDTRPYGGGDPLTFGEDYAMIDLRLEQFTEIRTDDHTVIDAARNPLGALRTLADQLDAANVSGVGLLGKYQRYLVREDLDEVSFLAKQDDAVPTRFGAFFFEPNGLYTGPHHVPDNTR